jgi:hypothetical protein
MEQACRQGVMDADSGTAMWASDDQKPAARAGDHSEHRSSSSERDHHRGREPPAKASPNYLNDAGTHPWPYELRFYDPPADGFVAMLRPLGAGLPRIYVSDYTLGLEQIPGFTPRPADLARSPAHNSDIVVVGRSFKP